LCPVIGLVFVTYALLNYVYRTARSVVEIQAPSLTFLMIGSVILIVSCTVGCIIRLRVYLPPDEGDNGTCGLGFDCSKLHLAVVGSDYFGFPLLDDGGNCKPPPELGFAKIASHLVKWIYQPMPNSIELINDLDHDITVVYISGSRSKQVHVTVPAGQQRPGALLLFLAFLHDTTVVF
jgi:hypothetical protein